MTAIKRNVVRQGVSAGVVGLACLLCYMFGWSSHYAIVDQLGQNARWFDAGVEIYNTFKSPESFLSAVGAFLLILAKVVQLLRNKRQGDR